MVSADPIKKKNSRHIYNLDASEAGGMQMPSDVAVTNNNVYVVDGANSRILVFDKNGRYQFKFGKKGKNRSELNYPLGIDVANNGNVYVADAGNKRIQVFSSSGKYIKSFKVKSGRYKIRPVDVLVDENSKKIFITANDTHEVLVYSLGGRYIKKWGGDGINEGEFRYPATLAHLKDKRVAVVDVLNSRLQVFERNGKYSAKITDWGVSAGQVFRPKGVAVDKKGNIYISDSYMNVVQVFNDSGEFLHVLTMPKKNKLYTPVGMTVDNHNRLYITEMRNNRVSVFDVSH